MARAQGEWEPAFAPFGEDVHTERWRRAESGSGTGHATARQGALRREKARNLSDPQTGLSFAHVTGHMAAGTGSSARCRRHAAALDAGLKGHG